MGFQRYRTSILHVFQARKQMHDRSPAIVLEVGMNSAAEKKLIVLQAGTMTSFQLWFPLLIIAVFLPILNLTRFVGSAGHRWGNAVPIGPIDSYRWTCETCCKCRNPRHSLLNVWAFRTTRNSLSCNPERHAIYDPANGLCHKDEGILHWIASADLSSDVVCSSFIRNSRDSWCVCVFPQSTTGKHVCVAVSSSVIQRKTRWSLTRVQQFLWVYHSDYC